MTKKQNRLLEATSANVHTLHLKGIKSGWEQWLLLSADRHHDSIFCDRKLERQHLEQVKERDALIFDFGDLFCAMQGKYDPRSSMDDIRVEDVGQNYLDLIVQHAADFYEPYVKHFAVIGQGNHETNIRKRHGTCLTSAVVSQLNSRGGNCLVGGYGGWVRIMFHIQKTQRQSLKLKYHHGAGGGGPVTRGVIQTNRQAVYLPDADIVVNGHTHDSWIVPIKRERLSDAGKVKQDLLWFIRTPGYKNEYADGSGGYHIEKWGPPKPIGAIWARLFFERNQVHVEFTQAIT